MGVRGYDLLEGSSKRHSKRRKTVGAHYRNGQVTGVEFQSHPAKDALLLSILEVELPNLIHSYSRQRSKLHIKLKDVSINPALLQRLGFSLSENGFVDAFRLIQEG